jgi:AraC-like DNA-binding protein
MWRTEIYLDPREEPTSGKIHVPAMGIHEVMPPGLVRHGGALTRYPSLIMIFHDKAWSLSPDSDTWLPTQQRLVVWEYEANHHYGNPTASWRHSWLRVTGRWIERQLRNTLVPLGVPVQIGGDSLPLRYLQMINDELRRNPVQDPDMLEGLLQIFWYDIERQFRAGPEVYRPDSRLERARRYLEAHFDKPFDLDEVAEMANLSRSHFCSSFSKRFHVPPREYAMRLRLQRGAQLLANQDLTVYQVADMVGCSDALYFSRLFRKRYGVSPLQYRRQQHMRPDLSSVADESPN